MNSPSTMEAIHKVFEDIKNMSNKDFVEKMKSYEDSDLTRAFEDLYEFGEYLSIKEKTSES